MFKCTVCQKLHNTKVQYCDCGNDEFEEISSMPEKQSFKINSKQLFSQVIFALCIALSVWVWFGTGSAKPKHKTAPKKEIHQVQKNIPHIDNIWDDSPAYRK